MEVLTGTNKGSTMNEQPPITPIQQMENTLLETTPQEMVGYFEGGQQFVNIEGEKYKVMSQKRWWEDPAVIESLKQAGVMT